MNLNTTDDVCDLDAIYSSAYSYSLPKGVLKGFLSGKAFDYPKEYTSDESARLKADINELFRAMMESNPVRDNLAVISAGSPGVGKTTLLRPRLLPKPHLEPTEVCQIQLYTSKSKGNPLPRWVQL